VYLLLLTTSVTSVKAPLYRAKACTVKKAPGLFVMLHTVLKCGQLSVFAKKSDKNLGTVNTTFMASFWTLLGRVSPGIKEQT